jgi:hypothetical protein
MKILQNARTVFLGYCLSVASLAADQADRLQTFEGIKSEGGIGVKWDRAGADFVDVFRRKESGEWGRLLVVTPLEEVKGLDGNELRFAIGNPLMWRFRNVAKGLPAEGTPSVAFDAEGNPGICYVTVEEGIARIRLARMKGLRWIGEEVAVANAFGVGLVFLPNGNPAIAYFTGEGALFYAEQNADGEWESQNIGKASGLAMVISPLGIPAIACVVDGDGGALPFIILTQRTADGWTTEKIKVEKGFPMSVKLAFAPNGHPGIAYQLITEGFKSQIQLSTQTKDGWLDQDVASEGSFPDLEFDSKGNPAVSFHSAKKGIILASPADGKWGNVVVDPGPCGGAPSLAIDAAGRPAILYQDTTNPMKPRLRYASHDGLAWHKTTLWTAGGDSGLSMMLDPVGRPAFCFVHEDKGLLRYGTLVSYDKDARGDDSPIRPVLDRKEMALQGEKLPIQMASIIGEWLRPDPALATETTQIGLTAEGRFTYGLGGGVPGLLPDEFLRYQGTFDLKDGIIIGKWKKEGNQLAVAYEEEMRIEVVAVTESHLEVRLHEGRPTEIFRRVK